MKKKYLTYGRDKKPTISPGRDVGKASIENILAFLLDIITM